MPLTLLGCGVLLPPYLGVVLVKQSAPERVVPKDALPCPPGGQELTGILCLAAEIGADGRSQTRSESAAAAWESTCSPAPRSSRSVHDSQRPDPRCWLPEGRPTGPSFADGHLVCLPADSKLGPRAAGTRGPTGTATGQPGAEGESVFSKILPGGAAEQAGKLTEGESRHHVAAVRWSWAAQGWRPGASVGMHRSHGRGCASSKVRWL